MSKINEQDDSAPGFSLIDTWIFDLDNTLYPAGNNLFTQIDRRMREYISNLFDVCHDEARNIQKTYYHRHGTTLSGLMTEHGIEPGNFLEYVHDVDVSRIKPAPELGQAIGKLPGRKIVFTNGSRSHAQNVTDRLGFSSLFDGVFGIEAADYIPKPKQAAYAAIIDRYDIDPRKAAMFEDMARNLVIPHDMGMTTILVEEPSHNWQEDPGSSDSIFHTDDHLHIHFHTEDLASFLDTKVHGRAEPPQDDT